MKLKKTICFILVYVENEELDDEYEESPENMTLKEKAEAEGMSVREYISEVSFRRGPVGVISGIGFGIIGRMCEKARRARANTARYSHDYDSSFGSGFGGGFSSGGGFSGGW